MVFTAKQLVLLSYFHLMQYTDFVQIKSNGRAAINLQHMKDSLIFSSRNECDSIHGATTAQLFSSFVRSVQGYTKKNSFPVLYISLGGCDGDSQSQVPSATLHVSITLCCPFACLAGLADVNKMVTPFPIWAHAGHPTPYAPRGRDWGDGTDKAHPRGLGKQCQSISDS